MKDQWIFLCYRRHDSSAYAARIFHALEARFPAQVFQDVERIEIGARWTECCSSSSGPNGRA
jgi:hypothetical protein